MPDPPPVMRTVSAAWVFTEHTLLENKP